jgi:hypothetical protein
MTTSGGSVPSVWQVEGAEQAIEAGEGHEIALTASGAFSVNQFEPLSVVATRNYPSPAATQSLVEAHDARGSGLLRAE